MEVVQFQCGTPSRTTTAQKAIRMRRRVQIMLADSGGASDGFMSSEVDLGASSVVEDVSDMLLFIFIPLLLSTTSVVSPLGVGGNVFIPEETGGLKWLGDRSGETCSAELDWVDWVGKPGKESLTLRNHHFSPVSPVSPVSPFSLSHDIRVLDGPLPTLLS